MSTQSLLHPEKPLIISPQLAATIGLEEAVLLSVLNDFAIMNTQDSNWYALPQQQLSQLLPFWQSTQIERIAASLHDKGIIAIEPQPIAQSQQLRFSLDANTAAQPPAGQSSIQQAPAQPAPIQQTPVQQPSLHKQPAATPANPVRGAKLISADWTPEEDLIQLLTMNHGIPREFTLGQLEDFILYWQERREVAHSWTSKFRQHVIRQWRYRESEQAVQQQGSIHRNWRPSEDAVEILTKSGVTPDFIDEAIPEFVLYWQERKDAGSNWNTRFIAHIRRQWASYRSTANRDTLPSLITPDWQPSADVYDILHLANIDAQFARSLIPEFILFWRDSNQPQRSWNTKFLQHVKYHWAQKHQLNTSRTGVNAEQQATDQQGNKPRSTRERSLSEDLNDTSWAG